MKTALLSLTFALVSTTALLPMNASAAANTCTIKSRNDQLVLMHCPAGTSEQVWIEAAKAACKPGQPCNVWIWEDASKVPATAPKTDADLPKTSTGAAVAVWVNDAGSLMKLKKVR